MKKTVGDIDKELAKKYKGYITSRLRDEKKNAYYHRLTKIILEVNSGELPISELRSEVKKVSKVTKESVMQGFLLNSILGEGSGVEMKDGIVKLVDLPLKVKARIRKMAREIVEEETEMSFGRLCQEVSIRIGTHFSKEKILDAICYGKSKLSVRFYKNGVRVFYENGNEDLYLW